MQKHIVLVCGGRNYYDKQLLNNVLDEHHHSRNITTIMHGAATGADKLAGDWCKDRGVKEDAHPANWSLGRCAGPLRNQKMIDLAPDVVIAFPGGAGTSDTIKRAKKSGINVIII